jgi:hypothetical protein
MNLSRTIRTALAVTALGVGATACQNAPAPAAPPANRLPVGELVATRTSEGIVVDATASDPNSPNTPVEVKVSVNGTHRLVAVADGVADGRDDRVRATVTDLSGITSPIVTVCLDVADNETAQRVTVACVVTAGTRIVTNGAVGSVVDKASGVYVVHGVAIDPNTDAAVPMRLRSVAGPVELASVTFVADRDTTGTVNPTVTAVNETLHAYGPNHGFEAAGLLDTTGADGVLLEAQRADGEWELVAYY